MYRYSIIRFLEKAAQSSPSKRAVTDAYASCSFAELRDQSRKAAASMIERGLVPENGVVVAAEKSIDALAAMFGALYAGSFYVPVDPSTPKARIEAICSVLNNPLVIVDDRTCSSLGGSSHSGSTLSLDDLFALSVKNDKDLIERPVVDSDAAYIMFTSGSTGTPKGVVVSHRAAAGFMESFVGTFGLCEEDVIANQAPFDFDVSAKDIYGALLSQATLVLIPREMFISPVELVSYLDEKQTTIMTWAVSALCLITSLHALDGTRLSSVRKVMFSGEVMPLSHLREWMSHLPNATFVNLYGPTEVTCNCLFHVIDASRDYSDGIPLGCTLPNREVSLLGAQGGPVRRPGEIGELIVRGSFLSSGYIGASAEENEAFSSYSWRGLSPEPTYRTGDLARYNEAGELMYCGRMDNQVKHMGHRIELEEIETVLESFPKIRRCRCVYDSKKKRIVAFFEGEATAQEIRQCANRHLPAAMRPSRLVCKERMPITKNGKVDRAALLKEVIKDHE